MRISDWSSDVCSSDLPARQSPVSEGLPQQRARVAPLSAATLRHSLVNLRLRGGRRQGGRQGRIASGLRLGCECVGVPPTAQRLVEIDQSERGAGDRKSVVSGKSVSVRVDLGGRRSIKKQK